MRGHHRIAVALGALLLGTASPASAQGQPTPAAAVSDAVAGVPGAGEPKVILITFDGVRWREIFRGADPALVGDARFVQPDIRDDVVGPAYLAPADRAGALMPFLHGVVARQGVLYGNRDAGECARVANDMWFSYPGYNELLTGRPDPTITSNDKRPNPNRSVLEYLDHLPAFHGQVGMVGTWDVFPFILNTARSQVPVNADVTGWPTDVKTEREGLRLLARHQRVSYIAFGDTDEFAHAGDYAHYLMALERGDDFLRRVWEQVQADPWYRDQTTLIVLTDHGRGDEPLVAWREHGSPRSYQLAPKEAPEYNATGAVGSGAIWFGALGPGIARATRGSTDTTPGSRAAAEPCLLQAQTPASILALLGLDWRDFHPLADQPDVITPPPLPFVTTATGR